jgi:lysozyme
MRYITSPAGIKLIHHFESCILKPYLCQSGVPTIGWGNTFYPNGKKVTMRDKPITQAYADQIFLFVLSLFEKDVNSLVKVVIKQHQFDALVSFAFNVGSDIDADDIPEGLGDSKLLEKLNKNPHDPSISNEFHKWVNSRGKVSNGLVRRRNVEAYYFSTGILKFNFNLN